MAKQSEMYQRAIAFTEATDTYLQLEASAKKFESAKKLLKEEIKPDESEVYNDVLSIKRDKRGSVRITKKKGE